MIGGVTYEESLAVHQFCRTNSAVRVVLGGTTFHNSQSFAADVEAAVRSATTAPTKRVGPSTADGRHIKYT